MGWLRGLLDGRAGSWFALGVCVILLGCGKSHLVLGDYCNDNPGNGMPDPCAAEGLACEFAIDADGGVGWTCQVPFGSVDGGLGMPCGQGQNTGTECTPYGLQCTPVFEAGKPVNLSCQLPFIGQCAVNVGCATGYRCLPDPSLGGQLQCFEACESSSDCGLAEDHCTDALGQLTCSTDACGGTSGNGVPFQACDNAGTGDGYCYPNGGDGSGSCFASGILAEGSLCLLGHSAMGCAPGLLCTFGAEGPFAPTMCLAACAMPASQVHAEDGGPGCAAGQTCTQSLPFHFSASDPAGVCVQDCAPNGAPPCPAHTSCQPIEDGGYACLN